MGVAPGASLLNVRVIDSKGSGQISDIIAGIDWAIDNGADVLSMSLGGLNLGESNPPISMAADNAMDAGTVVCVAAGNLDERLLLLMLVASSVCLGCVESPGDGVKVITVGATDCDDRIAAFSGSGPLRDGRYKPTLVAPGVNVVLSTPRRRSTRPTTRGQGSWTPRGPSASSTRGSSLELFPTAGRREGGSTETSG